MQEIKNKFGLREKKTGKVVGYETSSNADGDCCETQYILSSREEQMWLVDDPQLAEWVRFNSTEWYNANYDTPTHNFEPEELEVVEVTVEIKLEPADVKIPTPFEFYKGKYEKRDPAHWKYLQKELADGHRPLGYGWYDFVIDREKKGK